MPAVSKKAPPAPKPAAAPPEIQVVEQERQVMAARRMIRLKKAAEDLISFTELMMPHPSDPDNPDASRYIPVKHHRIIGAALQEVDKGNILRLIITMPPRAGKTELCSKKFVPWLLGRDSYRHCIFATYNEEFARDIGREVRETMRTPYYKQVFPLCTLRAGSASADRVQTKEGGIASFVGKGGSITGRGADFLLIDDPIKDREEADSKAQREKLWTWFTQVAMTRLMNSASRVVIIMTRWHEDDIVGRLTDPQNECYNREEAAKWKILALPAIAVENDPMGRQPGESLWPERFPIEHLKAAQRLDAKGFSSLYQGNPTPEDGEFFRKDWLKTYQPHELPTSLRTYVSSDHAVSTAQTADLTCLLPVGVCGNGLIWVLPDIFWRKAPTDIVVEAIIAMIKRHAPLCWWAEKGHISKSIGPFLHKRMLETNTFCAIHEVTPTKDKMTRAQSIQARCSMGRVRFPGFAPWWQDALQELLKFPSGRHDDFVDALSWVGLGLGSLVSAAPPQIRPEGPQPGTLAWVKLSSKMEQRQALIKTAGGF